MALQAATSNRRNESSTDRDEAPRGRVKWAKRAWDLYQRRRAPTILGLVVSLLVCQWSARWLMLRYVVGPRVANAIIDTWSQQFDVDIEIGGWEMNASELLLTLSDVKVTVDNTIREREIFEADAVLLQGALRYSLFGLVTLRPVRDIVHDLLSPDQPAHFAWRMQGVELDNPTIKIDQGLAGENNLMGVLRDAISVDARARTTGRGRYPIGFFLERALRRPDALDLDEGQRFQLPLIRADNLELEWSQERNVPSEVGGYVVATETRALSRVTLVIQDFYWPMDDDHMASDFEFGGRFGSGTVSIRGDANFLTDPPKIHAFVNVNNVSAKSVLLAIPPGKFGRDDGTISGQFEIVYEFGTLTGDGTLDFINVGLVDGRTGQGTSIRESIEMEFSYRKETSEYGLLAQLSLAALVQVAAVVDLGDLIASLPDLDQPPKRDLNAARDDFQQAASVQTAEAVAKATKNVFGEEMGAAVGEAAGAILADAMTQPEEPHSRIAETAMPRTERGNLAVRVGKSTKRFVTGQSRADAEIGAREMVEEGRFACGWLEGPLKEIDDGLRRESVRKCGRFTYRVAPGDSGLFFVSCQQNKKLYVLDAMVPHAAKVKKKGLMDPC